MESQLKKYKRFQYSQETLEIALTRIHNKELSANKASKLYGIPKSTLSNKLNNKVPLQRKMGPATELTFAEEKMLEDWIIAKAKLGFPMHPDEVLDTVETFVKENNRTNKFTDDRPGKRWLSLFLKRHPEVTKRNSEIISKARAAVTEEAIRNWFLELEKFLEEENALDIKDDPTRIFNSDETGVMTCPKTGLILGPKNYKNTYEIASGKEKESITVLCTFSADGTDVPPFVLYPYKRMPPAVVQNFPDTWYIGRSDSGWMVSATFFSYIKLFYEWLVKNEIKLPVLLFLDGHKSHINRDMFDFCREKGIMIFCLYPNSTHILQPCDVGIFGPLKKSWKRVVRKHKQSSTAPITKQNFSAKFKLAYDKSIKATTIQNSFRTCGLYPMSPDAVDYSRCINNRRQEIEQIRNITAIHEHKDDLRSTIKVIEADVGQIMRNEFVMAYNLNNSHCHQYFALWKKCKAELENKNDNHMTTPNTVNIPLDLSASSMEVSTVNENNEISQTQESNNVTNIIDSEITSVITVAQIHASDLDLANQTCKEIIPADGYLSFGETNISQNLPSFDTTEDIVEFIIENETNLPDIIPLPWHDTTETIILEDDSTLNPQNSCSSAQCKISPIPATPSCSNMNDSDTVAHSPQSHCSSAPSKILPIPAIPSYSNINDSDILAEALLNPQTTIISSTDPSTSSISSKDINKKALQLFLKYPEIPPKKLKIPTKKEPAPYGLTGLKYKEYLKKQDDDKKAKEEEIATKKRKREEKKLSREKSQPRSQLKRPKKDGKRQTKKRKENDNDTLESLDQSFAIGTDNLEEKKETAMKINNITTFRTAAENNLFEKYVVVQFNSGKRMRHFVGKVIMVNDEERKYKVDFLRKKSVVDNVVNFAKPIVPDIVEVDFDDVKRILGAPNVSRRGIICFDDLVFKDIE